MGQDEVRRQDEDLGQGQDARQQGDEARHRQAAVQHGPAGREAVDDQAAGRQSAPEAQQHQRPRTKRLRHDRLFRRRRRRSDVRTGLRAWR